MNFATIRQSLYTWINSVSGKTTIWLDQGQPRPPKPYIGLKVISGPTIIGSDENRLSAAEPGVLKINGVRRMTLSVNVYSEVELAVDSVTALDIASQLQTSLSRDSILAALRVAGLSVWDTGGVQDLSGLLETRYERRARFDVVFGLVANDTDNPGYIATVNSSMI